MRTVQLRRLDVLITRLVEVRSIIQTNFEVEFEIDEIIEVVEPSVNLLHREVTEESKEL